MEMVRRETYEPEFLQAVQEVAETVILHRSATSITEKHSIEDGRTRKINFISSVMG